MVNVAPQRLTTTASGLISAALINQWNGVQHISAYSFLAFARITSSVLRAGQ
jgi:hypothetical protein